MDEPRDSELESLRTLWDAPEPSCGLARRVFAAYMQEFDRAPIWRRALKVRVALPVAAAASLLMLALFFALLFQSSPVVQAPHRIRYRLVSHPHFIVISQGEHP